MARLSEKQKQARDYGDNQETIPVLIPERRYQALKILAYQKGSRINKKVRDAIEEMFGDELDKVEESLNMDSGQLESSQNSLKANARWEMTG